MIKIENVQLSGWEPAIRGMRNPMNSWERSDSLFYERDEYHDIIGNSGPYNGEYNIYKCGSVELGKNDEDLMSRLRDGGPVHAKYRRMIIVYMDITAPFYWWKEFDTYKVGTVANSCSTMHKIQEKEFTVDDFSREHLMSYKESSKDINEVPSIETSPYLDVKCYLSPTSLFYRTIDMLNVCREKYLETKDKKYWWQMIQLLPSSYNQKRTVMLNYEVLANMYEYRKNHKLDEWVEFCGFIKHLPYSWIIIGKDE